MSLKVGQSVELTDKGVRGKIAYIGATKFAKDKWIGIVLDEAKGKNNGTIDGVTYFQCPMNFGLFVKFNSPTIKLLSGGRDEDKTGSNSSLASSTSTTSNKPTSSKLPKRPSAAFGSRSSINKMTASTSSDKGESNLPKLSGQLSKDEAQQLPGDLDQLASQPIATTNLKPISRPAPSTVDVKTMVSKRMNETILIFQCFN